ncbi:MAG: hypothetical protein BV459_08240 [Thermoplasmata archaeon M11B2D]|nr:MAG: hypothetical protein BV459_08240 [Thermoplasmata archaeon M11B2D]
MSCTNGIVCFEEGIVARIGNQPKSDNPYARGTPSYNNWNDGWATQDFELRDLPVDLLIQEQDSFYGDTNEIY